MTRSRPILAALGLALCTLTAAHAADAPPAKGVLLVVNSDPKLRRTVEGHLDVFDPETGAKLASIPEGGVAAHEVVVTPDGRYAYLPIYGSGVVGGVGFNGTTITIVDVAQRKVVDKIDLGRQLRPHYGVAGPDGMLYITAEMGQEVLVVDPKQRKVVGEIPTGQPESHNIVLSSDGTRGYTPNVYAGTVSVLDIKGRKLTKVIKVTQESRTASGTRTNWRVQRIAISNDDKHVFTCDWERNELAVIDTASLEVTKRIPMASPCYGLTPTPDGKWLLASNNTANKVSVVDLAKLEVAKTIDVPAGPGGIFVRPDHQFAYVSGNPSYKIAAIRLSDMSVQKVIDAGADPDGMGFGGVKQ